MYVFYFQFLCLEIVGAVIFDWASLFLYCNDNVFVVSIQMQNYLHCNSCDGKHRRYSTDRFVLTARFCGRCNTRHAAKEVHVLLH